MENEKCSNWSTHLRKLLSNYDSIKPLWIEGRAEDRMKYWLETRGKKKKKKIVTQERSGYPQCLYFLVLEYYTTRDNLNWTSNNTKWKCKDGSTEPKKK